MAVVLTSATKPSPGNCNHRVVTINVDSGERLIVTTLTLAELDEPLTDDDVRAALKTWARYQRSNGVAVASLIGATIFAEVV